MPARQRGHAHPARARRCRHGVGHERRHGQSRTRIERRHTTVDSATFTFDQSWQFDVAPDRLWAACADTESFRRWWPWLRRFDPVPLEAGARTRAAIGPPLPYLLNVEL